jgi:transposase
MARSKEYYKKLRKEAHDLYVNDGLSNKEISERLKVSEKSVSKWINDNEGLWKKERRAAVVNSKQQAGNIKEIIRMLAEDKLDILQRIDEAEKEGDKELVMELRKQAASLDNSVNAWGKQMENINKENRITLSVYLEVMDRVFDAMKTNNPHLYYESLDFQEAHIYDVSKLLG